MSMWFALEAQQGAQLLRSTLSVQGSSRHSSEQDMAEARAPTPSSTHPQPSLRILQRPSAAETPVPAAAVVQPPLDLAALEGAIGEQLGGAHKKFVGHISLMYRELLKAMRSEMTSQVQQVQQAVSQRVDAALAASAQQVGAVNGDQRGGARYQLLMRQGDRGSL